MEEAWERALDAACAGEDPSALRSLTLDGVLKCSQGRLPSPSLFRRFSQLRVLSIANVGLTSLAGFPSLPHLQRLVLSDNRISGGLEHLVNAGLHVLRDLDLSNNKIVLLSSLAPLSGLNLLSLDLYECPVTRVPDYRSEVFAMIKSLQLLDKIDAENNERLESDEEEEDDDDDDDEDEVDDELTDGIEANGDEEDGGKLNGLAASSNGLEEEEDGDEDEDRDGDESEEVDEDEEEQAVAVASAAGYQDLGKSNYLGVQSNDVSGSDEEEVDDDEGGDNVIEVQEVEESEEDDDDDDEEDEEEVEVGDDDSEEEAGEDEQDDDQDDDQDEDDVEEEVEEAVSVCQFVGADGVIDAQDNEDDGEEENGEIGDEDDDEGDGIDNNDGDEEDDDDDDEEDDYGTEYLVHPIKHAEEEEASSDFEPGDGDENDDEDEDIDDEHGDETAIPPSVKRKRGDEGRVDSDHGDERPPKR